MAESTAAPTGARFDSPGGPTYRSVPVLGKHRQRQESPIGARFQDAQIVVYKHESRPFRAKPIYLPLPRAAPWAIESRPLGAERRLRRRHIAGTEATSIVITCFPLNSPPVEQCRSRPAGRDLVRRSPSSSLVGGVRAAPSRRQSLPPSPSRRSRRRAKVAAANQTLLQTAVAILDSRNSLPNIAAVTSWA